MTSVMPAEYADALIQAVGSQDGQLLGQLFQLDPFVSQSVPTLSGAVLPHLRDGRAQRIQPALLRCQGFLAQPWTDIATNQLVVTQRLALIPPHVLHACMRSATAKTVDLDSVAESVSRKTTRDALSDAWEAMNALVTAVLRWFSTLQSGRWSLPALLVVLSNHRKLSVLADNALLTGAGAASTSTSGQQRHLEECARQLNKAFSACVADRTTEDDTSRKWGTYEVVGLVFRGYFKLKTLSLCRNILRAIGAADIPSLESFPIAQQLTFRYYTGVLAFLGEEYAKAESDLTFAFSHCHYDARHNQEMILQYLMPCRLLRGSLPAEALLARYPRLANLYAPFVTAIRRGDVQLYDTSLAADATERTLVLNGTYLAVERAREICLRGLLKRVYRCKGGSSRVALSDFHTALRFVGVDLELLETEWLVATQIAKGYMRGYISHGHMMTVLSAQNPFPRLQTVPAA